MAKRIPRKTRNRISYKELTFRIGELESQNIGLRQWVNEETTKLANANEALKIIKNIIGPEIANLSEKELRILQVLHKQHVLKVEIKPVMVYSLNVDNIWVPT